MSSNSRVFISTDPFSRQSSTPIDLLNNSGIAYDINPFNRRMTEDELADVIGGYTAIIAGTEPISKKVLDRAHNLKLISRVGVGLDSVDLLEAKRLGILVSYTPTAPSPAVAELTVGLILGLLRDIYLVNNEMHSKKWNRRCGKRVSKSVIGIIGVGKIGLNVLNLLSAFKGVKFLLNDINSSAICIPRGIDCSWESKDYIFKNSDLITLHLPLSDSTRKLINSETLNCMKSSSYIVNTSRGGIVSEHDLVKALREGKVRGAAIDVFEEEPYYGQLCEIPNCILTSHMGSMSQDCRDQMEVEAVKEVIEFIVNGVQKSAVPDIEYKLRKA